jgi:hypothetical protein
MHPTLANSFLRCVLFTLPAPLWGRQCSFCFTDESTEAQGISIQGLDLNLCLKQSQHFPLLTLTLAPKGTWSETGALEVWLAFTFPRGMIQSWGSQSWLHVRSALSWVCTPCFVRNLLVLCFPDFSVSRLQDHLNCWQLVPRLSDSVSLELAWESAFLTNFLVQLLLLTGDLTTVFGRCFSN